MTRKDKDEGLQLALRAAGGTLALAAKLGDVTGAAISQWRRVPPHRVLEVSRITGVPRSRLRPDLYPPARRSR